MVVVLVIGADHGARERAPVVVKWELHVCDVALRPCGFGGLHGGRAFPSGALLLGSALQDSVIQSTEDGELGS